MKASISQGLLIFIFSFSISYQTWSQTLFGAQIDNRAGIKGLTLNPANVINPRLKAEIHLLSFSGYVGNDYIGINLSNLNNITTFRSLQENSSLNPKPNNNFVGNLDFMGPGFQMNLSPKHSIALSTRLRTFFNLNNIGGEFFESISSPGDESENYEVLMRDLEGIFHLWGEIGLTYGRVIIEQENYSIRGAATFKYLGGAGGAIGSSDLFGAVYLQNPNTLTTQGQFRYGYSNNFDIENINLDNLKSGFGMDLGFIFEMKNQTERAYTDGYKFKAGVSVLDIGGVNYAEFSRWNYDMNNTISLDELNEGNFQDVLEENYEGLRTDKASKLGMPTSLQIFADYAITNRFYLAAQGSISLRNHQELPVSQIVNNFMLTPRMETGWLSVYSPISYRQYEGSLSWGLGFRIGPATIGSGSILTNLISKNSRSIDAYLGFQIPLYRKGVKGSQK
ncbi:hypothetical protein E4S40_08600 [Algoriphagus kandeliae]|uniref:DUF5723 domain-containing protein n=1 Tax=Algoriphagus kandeliae TaxID=2562278 RepID=A0A4Y9QX39_9BACT|nr:hypothetical protein [Algoriphagus kandeliae]TFV96272.1 hypothetical protein E4S40_08600 [Algoriphagus kandeliae]